jgi:hypothetical protein
MDEEVVTELIQEDFNTKNRITKIRANRTQLLQSTKY